MNKVDVEIFPCRLGDNSVTEMRFKAGDCIVCEFHGVKYYQKILSFYENECQYKFLDLKTGDINIWNTYYENSRLMTDEEKIEIL